MNKAEYEKYEARFLKFMAKEGIRNLSPVFAEGPYFSWRPCECCLRPLGGNREHATGYNPETKEIQEYAVCLDCLYYAEYGQLDDITMLDMEE